MEDRAALSESGGAALVVKENPAGRQQRKRERLPWNRYRLIDFIWDVWRMRPTWSGRRASAQLSIPSAMWISISRRQLTRDGRSNPSLRRTSMRTLYRDIANLRNAPGHGSISVRAPERCSLTWPSAMETRFGSVN